MQPLVNYVCPKEIIFFATILNYNLPTTKI